MKIPYKVTKRLRTLIALDFLGRLQYLSDNDKIYIREKPGCDVLVWDIHFNTLPQEIVYRADLPSELGAHYYQVPENVRLRGFLVVPVDVSISRIPRTVTFPSYKGQGKLFILATTVEETENLMAGETVVSLAAKETHMFMPLKENNWKEAEGKIRFESSLIDFLESAAGFNIPTDQFKLSMTKKEAQQ